MVIRAVVDPSLCEAHGQCAVESPGVFTLDEDGYSVAAAVIAEELRAEAERGARACPVSAIEIRDE
jgi:ferredoxin